MGNWYLAVDIGASSGRHILGRVENGRIELEEIYRFDNELVDKNGTLCWDHEALFQNVVNGIAECKRLGKIPATMGIDTWAVDFALLDGEDRLIGDTVGYRDGRTTGMDAEVERLVPFEELYRRTGIQKQIFNTVYQLMALKKNAPEQLEAAQSFLMMPEYLNFLLTGVKMNEYTNATSTAMVDAESGEWDLELIEKLGYPTRLFGTLHMPGTAVGRFSPEIEQRVGFNCTVVLPATHDTGSAYLAVPAKDEDTVYLSSGTWSLLGVESPTPVITPEGMAANFTNEGGYDKRYRVLKNIMGLWMIQSIRRNLDKKYSYAELEAMARESGEFTTLVDANDSVFLAPKSMLDTVCDEAEKAGRRPESIGEIVQCVYRSLAKCYADAIQNLEGITGKKYTALNIVGGGSKDGYLNELTAEATGLPVYAGPTEGTVIGNLLAQMLAGGEFAGIAAARAAVAESFAIQTIQP